MLKRLALALAVVVVVTAPAYAQSGDVSEDDVARAAQARRDVSLQVAVAMETYDAAVEQAVGLENDLSRMASALTDRERDLTLTNAEAREIARSMYMNASLGRLDLFSAESITEFRLGEGYLDRASRDGQATLDRLRAVKESYLTQQEVLDDALTRQQELTAELEQLALGLLTDLEAADSEYHAVAEQWTRQEAARIEAERLEAERRAREEEARRRAATSTTTTTTTTPQPTGTTQPPSTSQPPATTLPPETTTTTTTTLVPPPPENGKTCPVNGAVAFTDTWGAPRSGGRSHEGVDMIASRGTPLVALESASVMRIGNGGLGGKTVWLRAPSGDTYYYAHLDGWASGLSVGQSLDVGQLLGYVGNTGNAVYTVPHLHFEYHPGGGGAVNPYPLVADLCF